MLSAIYYEDNIDYQVNVQSVWNHNLWADRITVIRFASFARSIYRVLSVTAVSSVVSLSFLFITCHWDTFIASLG